MRNRTSPFFPFTSPRRVRSGLLIALVLTGLIAPSFADEYPLSATTNVKAILRSSPSTTSKQVQVFRAGSTVTVLGMEGDWYQVERGNFSGYIRQDLLRVNGAVPVPVSAQPGTDGYLPPPLQPGEAPVTAPPAAVAEADVPAAPTPAPALPDNTSAASNSFFSARILSQGSRGTEVRQLQQLLTQLGYSTGGVDGVFGPATRSAVIRFQAQNGLAADGVVGARTVSALNGGAVPAFAGSSSSLPAPTPPATPSNTAEATANTGSGTAIVPAPASRSYQMLSKGSSGQAVRDLQTGLQALGYYSGGITGMYDTATYNAVRAFQQNNGTGVDGVAGTATQTILYDRTPRPAWEAAPTPAPLPEGAGQMQGPATSQVEMAHWFNDVKKNYRAGQIYTVYDPASGLGWQLKFYAMGNHADSEPLTQLDTDIMNKAFGNVTTWTPKPIYAHMPDGRWILGTMHNTPHLKGAITTNGFDGHLCVHFYRDMEECRKNDPNYGVQNQNAIRSAWARIGH